MSTDLPDGAVSARAFRYSGETRIKRWLLFHGDRLRVSMLLLGFVLASLLLLGRLRPIQYRFLLTETEMIQTILNTILGGVILLVSIVVAIASVGVGQELTTVGEQRARVEDAIEFRHGVSLPPDVETIPPQTGHFLYALIRSIGDHAEQLESIDDDKYDPAFHEAVEALTEHIEANAEELLATLDLVEFGTTDELLVGLDYDVSWQLYRVNGLLVRWRDDLDREDRREIEALAESLEDFLIGREYFKSLYYKREFSDLSKTLLLVSLPVIVFITYVMLAIEVGLFPEVTVVGVSPLSVFMSLSFAISLFPYIVLTAYVFRAASITTRTLAAGPFVHGELPREDPDRDG